MRKRIEDLGRISVLLNLVLNFNVLKVNENLRFSIEDYLNWFFALDREAQERMLIEVIEIQGRIYEILGIADGLDPLNREGGREESDSDADSIFD